MKNKSIVSEINTKKWLLAQIKKDEVKPFRTYWWNFGKKTNDFKGTLKELLQKWNFKVAIIKHPTDKNTFGYRFKSHTGSIILALDVFSETTYTGASFIALKMVLAYLGDRAILTDGYREIRINF